MKLLNGWLKSSIGPPRIGPPISGLIGIGLWPNYLFGNPIPGGGGKFPPGYIEGPPSTGPNYNPIYGPSCEPYCGPS